MALKHWTHWTDSRLGDIFINVFLVTLITGLAILFTHGCQQSQKSKDYKYREWTLTWVPDTGGEPYSTKIVCRDFKNLLGTPDAPDCEGNARVVYDIYGNKYIDYDMAVRGDRIFDPRK